MSADELQKLLDDTSRRDVSWKSRGEVCGCIVVRRKVILDAEGSLIVGRDGPAFQIENCGELLMRGGQISTTSRHPAPTNHRVAQFERPGAAVVVSNGGSVKLDNVEVVGDIVGNDPRSGEWHLPLVLVLPDIARRSRTIFRIRGVTPYESLVASHMDSVGVTTQRIERGPVEFGIEIDATDVEAGVLLDGWLSFICEGLSRRLRIRTRVAVGPHASPNQPIVVWESPKWSLPLEVQEPIKKEYTPAKKTLGEAFGGKEPIAQSEKHDKLVPSEVSQTPTAITHEESSVKPPPLPTDVIGTIFPSSDTRTRPPLSKIFNREEIQPLSDANIDASAPREGLAGKVEKSSQSASSESHPASQKDLSAPESVPAPTEDCEKKSILPVKKPNGSVSSIFRPRNSE